MRCVAWKVLFAEGPNSGPPDERTRILRLIVSPRAGAGGCVAGWLERVRKVQSFQPLGFQAAPTGEAGVVVVVGGRSADRAAAGRPDPARQRAEVGGPAALGEHLRKEPGPSCYVLRGRRARSRCSYNRPALDVDVPYLILALIGVVYLLIGLYTLLRQAAGQGLLFFLWCLASARLYLLSPVPPLD